MDTVWELYEKPYYTNSYNKLPKTAKKVDFNFNFIFFSLSSFTSTPLSDQMSKVNGLSSFSEAVLILIPR